VLFPDDGMRHEIIDGEHYVTPSPNPRHQMQREYWLVDPERDHIIVWQRQADGSFPRVAESSREQHDVLTTPLLAELKIPLVQLFPER
jgi:Uma2 family endonuclease